jgi:hypothetical protein
MIIVNNLCLYAHQTIQDILRSPKELVLALHKELEKTHK